MASFLAGMLGPGLTAASQAVAGQQQGNIKGIMDTIQLARQKREDELKAILQGATVNHLNAQTAAAQDPTAYDSDRAVTVHTRSGVATPVQGITPKPHAPVEGTPEHRQALTEDEDIKRIHGWHPPQFPTIAILPGADGAPPQGVVTHGANVGSKVAIPGVIKNPPGAQGGNLAAPLAAKVGQFGEMLKKASDLMPATDALNVSLGNSAAQDVATHGVGAFGMHIPGTQGAGSMMVNRSPEYAKYQAALSPFILAAAHALSGARINDTQVQQIRASIEIKPGDAPEVRQQKHKNVIDLINSIGGSLPPDAIGAQEDQMEPNSMTQLKGYGYKNAIRKTAPVAPGTQHATTGASDPGGDINLGKVSHAQALWDAAVKLHGEAKVIQEYGPRPEN